jgi:hypothetical protein
VKHIFLWLILAVAMVSVDCNKVVNEFIHGGTTESITVQHQPVLSGLELHRTTPRMDPVTEEACGRYAEVLQESCPYSFNAAGGAQRLEHLCATGRLDMSVVEDILSPDPFSNVTY